MRALLVGHLAQLLVLERELVLEQLALALDRDVLADAHAERARDEARDAGQDDDAGAGFAPATPITSARFDTSPSLAPNTTGRRIPLTAVSCGAVAGGSACSRMPVAMERSSRRDAPRRQCRLSGRSGGRVEHSPHDHPRSSRAVPARDAHLFEAGTLEHRHQSDVGEANVDALAAGIDRIGLDARRTGGPRGRHDAIEQGGCHTLAPVAHSDAEAPDDPDGLLVDGRDGAGVREAWRLGAERDAAPACDVATDIGQESGRNVKGGQLPAKRFGAGFAGFTRDLVTAAPGLAPAANLSVTVQDQPDVVPALERGRDDLDCRAEGGLRAARASR